MKKALLVNGVEMTTAIRPGVTAAGNGLVVEVRNFLSAKLNLAAATITGGTLIARIQTGDQADGSDMADFEINDVVVTTDTLDTTNTETELDIVLEGAKQYIRVVTTITGTVSAHTATFVLGDARYTDNFFEQA